MTNHHEPSESNKQKLLNCIDSVYIAADCMSSIICNSSEKQHYCPSCYPSNITIKQLTLITV